MAHSEDLEKLRVAGVEQCSFFPFSDMFIEIYPSDHPHIIESLGENHPWSDEVAVAAFGRSCLRFVLDEEGLSDHIEHLESVRDELRRIKNENLKLGLVPIDTQMDKPGYLKAHKQFSEEQDQAELEGGTKARLAVGMVDPLRSRVAQVTGAASRIDGTENIIS